MIKYCGHCGHRLASREQDGRLRLVCPECDWTLYEDPKVAVAVIVGQEGRLLLNRRAIEPGLGAWSFPSGYVNRGERLEEAAAREAKEETGLDVRVGGLIGVYSESGNPVVLIFTRRRAGRVSRRREKRLARSVGLGRKACPRWRSSTTMVSSRSGAER
jgi:hypothetical protein